MPVASYSLVTPNQTAYLVVPDNSTYLANTHFKAAPDPISGSVQGLMMILSAFQYQSPLNSAIYNQAISSASHAAFIQSGGQDLQNKTTTYATKNGKESAQSLGITDTEMVIVYETAKVVRDKQLNVNGPKFYSLSTHLKVGENNGSVGLTWRFK